MPPRALKRKNEPRAGITCQLAGAAPALTCWTTAFASIMTLNLLHRIHRITHIPTRRTDNHAENSGRARQLYAEEAVVTIRIIAYPAGAHLHDIETEPGATHAPGSVS